MTDILIQPNADGDDDLTHGVVIDDATLPLSGQDAVALGLTLGTAYKLRVLGTAQTLTVTDVPAAFVSGDWSAATGSGAQEIDVTISSLPAANGQTISDVEYELDASGTWVSSGGTTSFTITAAAGATSYDIRLRAVNSNGEGAAGDTKAATSAAAAAATAPAQMTAPTFSDVSYETATVVRGAAPATGGSPITGYQMQYRPTSGGAWTEVNPFGATEALTGLDNDTEYEAQQRAVNGVGAGDWSSSGTFTTDQLPDILGNGGGTVDIVVDDGTFSVTVSGSSHAHQNGTFGPFATVDLDSGPVLVVAPVISGSAVEGSTLTAEPGLWVHEAADGTTTVTAIWQADGVDISGETGATYVTVGGDVGAEITYEEEATNSAGTRTSDSNGITVTAAAPAEYWAFTGSVATNVPASSTWVFTGSVATTVGDN